MPEFSPQAPGALPHSEALAEAAVDSLGELFSRDPLELGSVDIARIVEALRAQRVRFEAAEAATGGAKPPKATKGAVATLNSPVKNAGDMGL